MLTGKVVAFVENDHAETRTQMFHAQMRGIVSGNGQWMNVVLAASDHANRAAKYRV